MSFFKRIFGKNKKQSEEQVEKKASLDAGLEKSKKSVISRIAKVFSGRRKIDEDLLEDLEEALMMSDVGVDTTERIIERLRKRAVWEAYLDQSELINMLREEIAHLLVGDDIRQALTNHSVFSVDELDSGDGPAVILVVGVNGVGKTTSIGKLAHRYKSEGKKVMLGAADTFRAAAVSQLEIWAKKINAEIIKSKEGSDPASVAYKSLEYAKKSKFDYLLIDTAGRLQNKKNLMDEFKKITKVVKKIDSNAPHETFLILDATTGQNALNQVEEFKKITPITGIIMTKLDGTAKGGILLAIGKKFKLPIVALGMGEKEDDLQMFSARHYSNALMIN